MIKPKIEGITMSSSLQVPNKKKPYGRLDDTRDSDFTQSDYGNSKGVKFFTPRSKQREDDLWYASSRNHSEKSKSGYEENLDDFFKWSPHSKIIKRLRGVDLGEVCSCGTPSYKHMVLTTLMASATNWDRIVHSKLDSCVKVDGNAEDENDPRFSASVDFRPMFGYKRGIIKEILKQGHKKAQVVLSHPVLETYLYLHSNKLSRWIYLSFILYLTFVMVYTAYQITILFFRDPSISSGFTLFNGCSGGQHGGLECALAVAVLLLLLLLLAEEVLQVATFRERYYKRLDAWARLVIGSLICVSFFLQSNQRATRFISAITLPLAWFGVILRSTYNGATISVMFLHILQKRFLGGVLLALALSMTFGTAFLVLESKVDSVADLTFAEGISALFRPLLMLLGEFEFLAIIDPYMEESTDISKLDLFLVCLMVVGLALVGTLVLVNLLLALIVSDVNHLFKLSHKKSIFRMARQVVLFESLSRMCGSKKKQSNKGYAEELRVRICLHDFCNEACTATKIKDAQTKLKLKALAQRRAPTEFFDRPVTAANEINIDDIL